MRCNSARCHRRELNLPLQGITRPRFAAASEIQQLFQDPSVAIEPNDDRVHDFLVPWNFFRNEKDRPDTFFAGIYSVPAAHVLTVEAGRCELRGYWELTPPRPVRPPGCT